MHSKQQLTAMTTFPIASIFVASVKQQCVASQRTTMNHNGCSTIVSPVSKPSNKWLYQSDDHHSNNSTSMRSSIMQKLKKILLAMRLTEKRYQQTSNQNLNVSEYRKQSVHI
jgi:hypothetical protein